MMVAVTGSWRSRRSGFLAESESHLWLFILKTAGRLYRERKMLKLYELKCPQDMTVPREENKIHK